MLAVPDSAVCFEPPSKFSIDGVTEKVKEIEFEESLGPLLSAMFAAPFCDLQQGGGVEGAGEEVLGTGNGISCSQYKCHIINHLLENVMN